MNKVAIVLAIVLLLLAVGMAAADTSIDQVIPPDGAEGPPRGGMRLVQPGEDPPTVLPIAMPLNLVEQPEPDCPAKILEGGIWIEPDCGDALGYAGLNTAGLR